MTVSGWLGPTVKVERALMSVLRVLQGDRAAGVATVRATGDDVVLKTGSYAVPIIVSAAGSAQADFARLVKTTADVTVSSSGTEVPIASMLGGTAQNFPAGTRLRWLPAIGDVEAESVITTAMTGGVYAQGPGTVRRILSFESLGSGDRAGAFWRAQAGDFPAIVLAWDGSQGGTKSSIGTTSKKIKWTAYVVCTRMDAESERANEGKIIVDAIEALLGDRSTTEDNEVFSWPQAMLGASGRLLSSATSYVFFTEIFVSYAVNRRDLRTYAPWTTAHETLQTTPTPEHPSDPVTIVDQKQEMT